MDKKKIAYEYIQACQVQSCYEDQVSAAFQMLNADNQVFGLADPLHKAYMDLVIELLGEELFDWIQWWQYETDYGKDPKDFAVNNQEHTTDGMTLLKFLDIVA